MSSTQTAIVTGSSRGIGAASPSAWLRRGSLSLSITLALKSGGFGSCLHISHPGRRAAASQADVRDAAAFASLFDVAERKFGGLAGYPVNNAGMIEPGLVPIASTDDELFGSLVDTNLKGTFHGLRGRYSAAIRRTDREFFIKFG